MNKNVNNILRVGTLAVVGALTLASCSDTWDDHYEGTADLNYSGSTWEYLQSQSSLSDFVEVAKAAGYADVLASSQVFTILAPQNGSFDKESLLNLVSNGGKDNVVTRFLENHILRYNVSINNEEQTAKLLNDKTLKIGTLDSAYVSNADAVQTNLTCNNGVVHVISEPIDYYPNIFEQFQMDHDEWVAANGGIDTDSVVDLYSFLRKYDDDQLDVDRSVAQGMDENGNTVYVDSVMIRRNTVLQSLNAYLYREDSNYVALTPSNEAFLQRVADTKPYFKLNKIINPDQTVLDSLQEYYAQREAIADMFYNMNVNTVNDSAYSTSYSSGNWEYNVFYNPYSSEGIFSNVYEKDECSNGAVWRVNDYPYDIYQTFMRKLTREAEYDVQSGDDWTSSSQTIWTPTSNSSDSVSGSGYLYIQPATSTRQTKIAFNMPRYYAATYDIYLRILPQSVLTTWDSTQTVLPSRFRASLYEVDRTGNYPTKNAYQFKAADGSRNFVTDPDRIDSVYLGQYTFSDCYALSSTTGSYLQIESYVTTSQRSQYTKELLLDAIILVPVRNDEAEDSAAKRHL